MIQSIFYTADEAMAIGFCTQTYTTTAVLKSHTWLTICNIKTPFFQDLVPLEKKIQFKEKSDALQPLIRKSTLKSFKQLHDLLNKHMRAFYYKREYPPLPSPALNQK